MWSMVNAIITEVRYEINKLDTCSLSRFTKSRDLVSYFLPTHLAGSLQCQRDRKHQLPCALTVNG